MGLKDAAVEVDGGMFIAKGNCGGIVWVLDTSGSFLLKSM